MIEHLNHRFDTTGHVVDCPYNLHWASTIEQQSARMLGQRAVEHALQTLLVNGIPHELLLPLERYWAGKMSLADWQAWMEGVR